MIYVRYVVIFAIWLNMIAFFQSRVNMSVAVLKFTENLTNIDATVDDTKNSGMTYQWTKTAKNKLLASFFYGYAASQFLGGLVSSYFGPKRTIAVCLVLSSVLVTICPLIEKFGPIPLSIVRVVLGLLSGPLLPSMNMLVGSWGPTSERSLINSIMHSGILFGIAFGNVVGGLMSNSTLFVDGWKQFLYLSGGFDILVAIVWIIFVTDSPQNHPWVSSSEKKFIKSSTKQKSEPLSKSFKSIPFKKILKSYHVWLLTLALFGHLSIFFTFLVSLPIFLKNVCNVPSDQASYYSIIPFFGNFITLVTYPILIDYLRTKKRFNVTKLRRFSSALAFVGACVCLVPLGYVPTDTPFYAITLVTAAMCFLGCNCSGFLTAAIEMAPQYSGIIMGINNTFGSTTGFIIQLINAKLIEHNGQVIGWRYTFFIISASCLLFGLPFVLFGSSELQSWATPQSTRMDSSSSHEELL